jgi:hypothetical protein
MRPQQIAPTTWLWTVGAASALVWGLIALVAASIGPAQFVPHIFFSYRVEHFMAFYAITILAAVGLPGTRLTFIGASMVVLAAALELVRTAIPPHQMSTMRDYSADVGGVVAAVLPIIVGRLRNLAIESGAAKSG